jgi:hypothetical protein
MDKPAAAIDDLDATIRTYASAPGFEDDIASAAAAAPRVMPQRGEA